MARWKLGTYVEHTGGVAACTRGLAGLGLSAQNQPIVIRKGRRKDRQMITMACLYRREVSSGEIWTVELVPMNEDDSIGEVDLTCLWQRLLPLLSSAGLTRL